MKDKELSQAGEYLNMQLKLNGASIVTVSDGWVLTITKEKLLHLIEIIGDQKAAMILIKSSANLPVN